MIGGSFPRGSARAMTGNESRANRARQENHRGARPLQRHLRR